MSNILRQKKYIKSDVSQNNNKFWYITEFDNASCLVEYGRVGDKAQTKTHPFGSQYNATSFFDKKCKEKEGPKKGYEELKLATTASGTTGSISINPSSNLEEVALAQIQTNHKETEKLISRLAKVNIHNILSSTTLAYNVESGLFSTPLGVVTGDAINEARILLGDIGKFVSKKKFNEPEFIQSLNRYLRLVPQKVGRKLDPVTLYPDLASVQQQNDILDSLEVSLDSVNKGIKDASSKVVQNVPKLFESKLGLVEDGKIIDYVRNKYKNTRKDMHVCAHLDVKQVFSVDIASMSKAFEERKKTLSNCMELWHGTSTPNLLSIIKSGLIIPPANASYCTGRMFGNGTYFASSSTKSLNYSFGYWGNKRDSNCFMFIADVLMGNYYIPKGSYESLPKAGYDSSWAKSSLSGVANDEFIVYKTNQINLKYLVEFSPNGK